MEFEPEYTRGGTRGEGGGAGASKVRRKIIRDEDSVDGEFHFEGLGTQFSKPATTAAAGNSHFTNGYHTSSTKQTGVTPKRSAPTHERTNLTSPTLSRRTTTSLTAHNHDLAIENGIHSLRQNFKDKVASLEDEVTKLKQAVHEKEARVARLQEVQTDAEHRLKVSKEQGKKLSADRQTLIEESQKISEVGKKLKIDLARLRNFRKTLLETFKSIDGEDDYGINFDALDIDSATMLGSSFFDRSTFGSAHLESSPPYSFSDIKEERKPTPLTPQYKPESQYKSEHYKHEPQHKPESQYKSEPQYKPELQTKLDPHYKSDPLETTLRGKAASTPSKKQDVKKVSPSHSTHDPSKTAKSEPEQTPKNEQIDDEAKKRADEFFEIAKKKLTYEQYHVFLEHVKQYNSHQFSAEQLLQLATKLFGNESDLLRRLIEMVTP